MRARTEVEDRSKRIAEIDDERWALADEFLAWLSTSRAHGEKPSDAADRWLSLHHGDLGRAERGLVLWACLHFPDGRWRFTRHEES